MQDGTRRNKGRLAIHSHPKCDSNNNQMNVCIEHENKMGRVSPLGREKSLPSPLSDDSRKNNVLENSKINDILDLDMKIPKRCIITIM